jgi:ABC-type sugar transport system ATPase subunit
MVRLPGASGPIVEVRDAVKRYPGVVALAGVDFEVGSGEIIGLVGKNGAGKSSLVKVIAGAERLDEGELRIDGRPAPHGFAPHVAHRLGLAFVHQELGNFPTLSVAENVALGTRFPRRLGVLVSRKQLNRRVKEVLDELEAPIDPGQEVTRLTAVQQRLLMIARALYHDARVLFLDEPSVSLTIEEIAHLHRIVRQLRERGHSIVYVSHRLNEIVALTDRVVVMQDGQVTLEQSTRDLSEQSLIDEIAGTAGGSGTSPAAHPIDRSSRPILAVRNLRRPPLVADVSFELHAGEILGLAGLVGSGRTEVARMICGADRPAAGYIEVNNEPVRFRTPVDAIRRGIALLPENRRHEGLILDFGARENITLTSLPSHRLNPLLPIPNRASERRAAASIAARLAIAMPGLDQEVRRLSGGNQQKVVLAKWLHRSGRVLIFDEPTQGVDVGAKAEIFALVQELADEGRGIIFISSDFAELAMVCTRVVVLREGSVAGELMAPQVTEEALVRLAYAAGRQPAAGIRTAGERRHGS